MSEKSDRPRSASPTRNPLKESGGAVGTNVQVAVRCRPMNAEEKSSSMPSAVTCDTENKTVAVNFGPPGKKVIKNYNFDMLFGMYSTQDEVYQTVAKPIVDEALAGFNCTIFAYGQTGTGKTHTMEGDVYSAEFAGIVPRSVNAIVESLEASDTDYTIKVSFLELYNEELMDLFCPNPEKKLKLFEDVKKGVMCLNLEEISVTNSKDILEMLQKATTLRQTAATLCNKNSSRSHSIFTMKISRKDFNSEGEEVMKHGQLNLVDLAGSECIGRSGAKNERAREAGSINQSLLTLGRVITALVDHHGHIPYRDSKLTRLLQESLGGKAKTVIIATLSSSINNIEETISTLDYAYRAKSIKNQPTVNLVTKKLALSGYSDEVDALRAQLLQTRAKFGVYVNPEVFYEMESRLSSQENQIIECEAALNARTEECMTVRAERDEAAGKLEVSEASLQSSLAQIEDLQAQLSTKQTELAHAQKEWRACEKVVKEQLATEKALTAQGKHLQEDILNRRDDIIKLLDKISRFSDNEAARVKSASKLVNGIASSSLELQTGIKNMSGHTKEQNLLLCNGVGEMLTKGKSTCVTLKAAIDGALTILIGDATKARDNMTNSCDKLSVDLGTTNSHVAKTLGDLKNSLSKWLGEVDEGMKNAQLLLVKQNTQLDGVTAALVAQAADYTDLYSKFVIQLDLDFKTASLKSGSLGQDLQTMFLEYSDTFLRNAQKSKEQIELKAALVEETMRKLLREMVTTTTEYISTSTTAAGDFTTKASKATKTSLSDVDHSLSTTNGRIKAHTTAMTIKIEDNKNTQSYKIVAVEQTRTSTDVILEGIRRDAGAKRTTLDTTVTTLVGDVDTSLKKACVTVKETSVSADKVLKDVVSATQTMTTSTSTCLSNFDTFISKEGKVTQDALATHFTALDTYLAKQSEDISTVSAASQKYGEEAHVTLGSVGNTPKDIVFSVLEELVKSRDHDVIRKESRDAGKPPVAEDEEEEGEKEGENEEGEEQGEEEEEEEEA